MIEVLKVRDGSPSPSQRFGKRFRTIHWSWRTAPKCGESGDDILSESSATRPSHAGSIVHCRLDLIFMAMGAPQAHGKLGSSPRSITAKVDRCLEISYH